MTINLSRIALFHRLLAWATSSVAQPNVSVQQYSKHWTWVCQLHLAELKYQLEYRQEVPHSDTAIKEHFLWVRPYFQGAEMTYTEFHLMDSSSMSWSINEFACNSRMRACVYMRMCQREAFCLTHIKVLPDIIHSNSNKEQDIYFS